MEWIKDLDPQTIGVLIPLVAIVGGFIYATTKAVIRHRERLAMIQKGMHPDFPPGRQPPAEGPEQGS